MGTLSVSDKIRISSPFTEDQRRNNTLFHMSYCNRKGNNSFGKLLHAAGHDRHCHVRSTFYSTRLAAAGTGWAFNSAFHSSSFYESWIDVPSIIQENVNKCCTFSFCIILLPYVKLITTGAQSTCFQATSSWAGKSPTYGETWNIDTILTLTAVDLWPCSTLHKPGPYRYTVHF